MSAREFEGRVAIVTGSGRGFGQTTAVLLATRGASVIINDVDEERAAQTASEVHAAGGHSSVMVGDVTDVRVVEGIVERALAEYGHVDILINNVGGGSGFHEVRETSLEDWDQTLRLTLTSAFICSRAVLDHMINRGYGKIVCISSIAAAFGMRTGAAYAAAKAGLHGFIASLAKEVGRHGINVNAVMIGNADNPTPWRTQERVDLLNSWNHFGRFGRPEEFANAILFLASDQASYVSG
jgi:NAD(P)-dependent dehydrogenase (short-subunit alcohol dehydrogenase family)